MSVETASILSFATNGLTAPSKLAVPFPVAATAPPQTAATPAVGPADDRAQQAINAVKQANANWHGVRKSLAGFRLQYAQAALKALMFFGGDPAMVARRAAQLAREIRAAAQEYVAAGGDAADIPVQAQPAITDPGAQAQTVVASTTIGVTAAAPVSSGDGFADDAKLTLSILRAVVARNQPPGKSAQHHSGARAAFDDAAQAADAAVGHVGSAAGPFNILI
jgi:hypothetical protein